LRELPNGIAVGRCRRREPAQKGQKLHGAG
jgi:hypothetical protein